MVDIYCLRSGGPSLRAQALVQCIKIIHLWAILRYIKSFSCYVIRDFPSRRAGAQQEEVKGKRGKALSCLK